MKRVCCTCKVEKDLDTSFHRNKANELGRARRCKECVAVSNKEWFLRLDEKGLELHHQRARDQYIKTKGSEKHRAARDRYNRARVERRRAAKEATQ